GLGIQRGYHSWSDTLPALVKRRAMNLCRFLSPSLAYPRLAAIPRGKPRILPGCLISGRIVPMTPRSGCHSRFRG
ncbi:hypothetical protein A2U01_0089130, partial [Trifolium medium]|nr:hypothetical protein [Trifolium medium]